MKNQETATSSSGFKPNLNLPRLYNIHAGMEFKQVTCKLAAPVYDHLFSKVLSGDRGAQTSLINFFLQALSDELTSQGLVEFDLENNSKVAEIISRLNFKKPPARKSNG